MGLGSPELVLIVMVIVFWIAPLFLGYSIGKNRSMGGGVGFLLGFFLSYLGVIIVALSSRPQPMFYNFNTPKPAASSASSADELKKYKDLLDRGAISEEEYKQQKARILG